jgi:hypothetical protein
MYGMRKAGKPAAFRIAQYDIQIGNTKGGALSVPPLFFSTVVGRQVHAELQQPSFFGPRVHRSLGLH